MITQSKEGLSALNLHRLLGISFNAAMRMKHKLQHVMKKADDILVVLQGLVELDVEAKFPLLKTLEGFDFGAVPELDLRMFRELTTGDFIKERRNVIFLGRSGTGKTHLATALGIEACRNNYRTRFVSCYALVNELIEARQEKDLQRLLAPYARFDLLVLDEMGYIPFSKEGAELLFQVLAERHEKGSVIITTNLGFAYWTQIFGDPVMTAALLDRLTHEARIIPCPWDSYRLQESLKRQQAGEKN